MVTTQFIAEPAGGGERIALIRTTPSRLPFAKAAVEAVAFDYWTDDLPPGSRGVVARVLEALDGDVPLAVADADGVTLDARFVARLSEGDAAVLGLPPATRLTLDLRSRGLIHQADFRIEARWMKLGGIPASARVDGARVRHDGRDHRLPEPLYSTSQAVAAVNEAPDEAARQAALAALKGAMGTEGAGRVAADGVIERLRLTYASGFSLSLRAGQSGFDFDPVLFGRERLGEATEGAVLDEAADGLLPPAQAEDFARRFRRGDGGRRAYLLSDGAILFVDPQLSVALTVVRDAQRGTAEQRKAFARNPERAVAQALRAAGDGPGEAAALFIETEQFSQRVEGIDIWRKPVLPWIKPKPNSWLPEKFGLRIGDAPHETMVEIAPEALPAVAAAVEAAVAEERATFQFDGQQIPATEQARAAIASLTALVDQAGREDALEAADEAAARDRYFLQVADNLEVLAYAPAGPRCPSAQPPPAFPTAVVSEPKPHQVIGFEWLVAGWRAGLPGVLLADDMGLGKTLQALAFLSWVRDAAPGKPVLIVAPTGLLANWRAEIERHLAPGALGPLVNAYGAGLARLRDGAGRDIELSRSGVDAGALMDAGVVLTTFETMRDYHLSFARVPFSVIVYDEAQRLKNPASQMTRAAKTLNARFQVAMTGTPVENRLQDLWSLYDVVFPGLLGTSKAFETSYPASNAEQLRSLHDLLIEPQDDRPPVLLRRMKDDCLAGLPAKREQKFAMTMPPRQADAYDMAVARALVIKGTGQRGRMLEVLARLRGISLHPDPPDEAAGDAAWFEDSARTIQMFALLDSIAAKGEKALIFCESLAMQALLAVELRRRYRLPHPVARINGSIAGDLRQRAVERFQEAGDGFDVMILSPRAGGVGITLTAANHVIHLSRWWNPAVEDQATDRAYRIGQTRDVTVYLPQAVHPQYGASSFDLKLDALMMRKRTLSRGLLMPGDNEGDADALFNAVVGDGGAAELPDTVALSVERPIMPSPEPLGTLSVRPRPASGPPPAAVPFHRIPRRTAFEPGRMRDLSIFAEPATGCAVEMLDIVDPYACASPIRRDYVAQLVAHIASSAASIKHVRLTSWDADSTGRDSRETSEAQRADLKRRWDSKFGGRITLEHDQLSHRQTRLHDRSIAMRLADGSKGAWDLANGIDGVMDQTRACVVTYFPL